MKYIIDSYASGLQSFDVMGHISDGSNPVSYVSATVALPGGILSSSQHEAAVVSAVLSVLNSAPYSLGITASDIVFPWDAVAPSGYEGTIQRVSPIPVFKSATVSGGVAVFHLTVDGLSTGASLFPIGVIQDSIGLLVSDATASYQMSYVFSNSNKTVTVTANKLTTSNILTGILGQTAANGAVVKLTAFGY